MTIHPTTLIFGQTSDLHIKSVLEQISFETIPLILDLSKFGTDYVATYKYNDSLSLSIRDKNNNVFDLSSVKKIWWRRPQPFIPEKDLDEKLNSYAIQEMNCFWGGILSSLQYQHIDWFNDFDKHRAMDRKLNQLNLANQIGFLIPETCVTTDSDEAEEFIKKHNNEIIFKSFSGSEDFWQPTRKYDPKDAKFLKTLVNCPVIFQKYIESIAEYRVTIIENKMHIAIKRTESSKYKYDIRIDLSLKYEISTLPLVIEEKLYRFMKLAGLKYGAFDLILSKNHEIFFIEINPAGQFMHIELETGLKISESMAQSLSVNDESERVFSSNKQTTIHFAKGLFADLAVEKISHIS